MESHPGWLVIGPQRAGAEEEISGQPDLRGPLGSMCF